MPPNAPLLMTITWSPARLSLAIVSTRPVEIMRNPCALAERRERLCGIPAQVRAVAKHAIGEAKALGQQRFHQPELHRVGSRLDHRDDARIAADVAAQAVDGRGDGGRVVREVVVHRDAAGLATQLEPAPDAAKVGQRRQASCNGDAGVPRGRDRRQRIQLIVPAQQGIGRQTPLRRAAQLDRAVDRDRPVRPGVRNLGQPEALDLAPAAHPQHALQAFFAAVDDNATLARHRTHEMVELALRSRPGPERCRRDRTRGC